MLATRRPPLKSKTTSAHVEPCSINALVTNSRPNNFVGAIALSLYSTFYPFRSLNEFNTTEIEENAIAAAAIIGFKSPNAASGIAITL